MMKIMKKTIMIFMVAFLLFIGIGNVRAADEDTCSPSQLSELRSAAANVKVTYVPGTEAKEIGYSAETGASYVTTRFIDIKIYNVTEDLLVSASNGSQDWIISYSNVTSDGSVTIRQPSSTTSTVDYVFKVTSLKYGCSLENLRTIKLTLPKFNNYSELDVCADIPDYYLCQQYTTYSVDGSTFYDKVDEYKAKLLAMDTDVNLDDENTSIVSKAVSSVSKYKYVIVGIVVVAGIVLTVIVLKKKGSVV